MLLVAAVSILRSFWNLQSVDPGFRTDRVLTMQVWLPKAKYSVGRQVSAFYQQTLARVGTLPGVESAAGMNFRPFLGWSDGVEVDIEGREPARPDEIVRVGYRIVTPGFLQALGLPLVGGRNLTDQDDEQGLGVVLVNEEMVARYWPGENPINRRIRPVFGVTRAPWRPAVTSLDWMTVVGVVGDMRDSSLTSEADPLIYFSYAQVPSKLMFLLVRAESRPESLTRAVQRQVEEVDALQPVSDVRSLDNALSDVVARPRFNSTLLVLFAGLAVLLSMMGVYGATAHAVSQRDVEIATRMSLGAEPSGIWGMIIRETLVLVAIGTALGLVGAWLCSSILAGFLYGVVPTDFGTFAGVSLALLLVALVAAWVPARRAAGIDPIVSLKHAE